MGWLVLIVKGVVLWLDQRSERSLFKLIPDLGNVLYDPHQTFRNREIVIGPARRYGTGLFLWLLAAAVGWLGLAALMVLLLEGKKAAAAPGAGLLLLVAWLVLLGGSLVLILRCIRGGELVLTRRGVELKYRGTVVVCPWELFHTDGQPFSPDRDQLILPVVTAAVPAVQARRQDTLLAEGLRINTRQLWFRSPAEAVLRAFYEVNAVELGKVLLHLGQVLGTPTAAPPASLEFPPIDITETEPASLGTRGWLTVSLTRLVFPPVCCECGTETTGRQKFRAADSWFSVERLGYPAGKKAVNVWIPVCYACQTATKHKMDRGVFTGLGMALAAILLAAFLMWFFPANLALVLWFIMTVLLAPPLCTMLGYQLASRNAQPVQVAGYSSCRGTISLRFRRPEYSEQLIKAMNGKTGT
jgi:hypothetical protein